MKPFAQHTDEELVAFLKRKDPAACNYLYEKYGGVIYGLVKQVLHDHENSNESFVEIFASIIQSIDQYDPLKTRLFTWMMQNARQKAIEKLKATPPRRYSVLPVSNINANPVTRMIHDLHQDEQKVINLTYLKGYSVEEVAGELGMTADNVRATMNKALQALNSQAKK